ncbi:hypothetical protein DY000_02061537 [Brassica cretica]|uniref:Uncharacterized protein n=1 Tax=Brassica cretica TaxID=69181 RepID=A0ABQ7AUL1_BRACR|nr:hypothetical protein DY000_02061537 [Brassica cretica]
MTTKMIIMEYKSVLKIYLMPSVLHFPKLHLKFQNLKIYLLVPHHTTIRIPTARRLASSDVKLLETNQNPNCKRPNPNPKTETNGNPNRKHGLMTGVNLTVIVFER